MPHDSQSRLSINLESVEREKIKQLEKSLKLLIIKLCGK